MNKRDTRDSKRNRCVYLSLCRLPLRLISILSSCIEHTQLLRSLPLKPPDLDSVWKHHYKVMSVCFRMLSEKNASKSSPVSSGQFCLRPRRKEREGRTGGRGNKEVSSWLNEDGSRTKRHNVLTWEGLIDTLLRRYRADDTGLKTVIPSLTTDLQKHLHTSSSCSASRILNRR